MKMPLAVCLPCLPLSLSASEGSAWHEAQVRALSPHLWLLYKVVELSKGEPLEWQ
jgi:hypothetical protein